MPFYSYKAKGGPDKIVTGEIEAPSQDIAVEKLAERGLMPVSISQVEEAGQRRELPAGVSAGASWARVKQKELDIFTRQLASLIRAGVPVLRALSLIASQTETRSLKAVAEGIGIQISEGKMLSEALSRYPNVFNGLYISMIKAGEKSGTLDEVLYRLADYREKEDEIRRKIQASAAYPTLVIIVGIISVFIMLTFFLPKLMSIFTDMSQLPLPTRILKQVSDFMSANWIGVLLGFALLFALFFGAKPGSYKKQILDAVKINMPFVRKFVRNAEIARFARTLELLFKNGISVHESLQLSADTVDNEALKEQLKKAQEEIINKGQTLSASLKKIGIFPTFAVNMIAVGEEGGRLEESLAEIANVYDREVDQSIKIMTSLLEPVLILVVGGIVGFIVFAMLLPIFNIGFVVK
ncbi:MAG: type II secretion system F family protein [Candidatus Omnitrophota bacterium]